MKKITLLVSQRDVEASLRRLRKLGVVHISHMQEPVADYISSLKQQLSLSDEAMNIIPDSRRPTDSLHQPKDLKTEDLNSLAKEIIDQNSQRQKLKLRQEALERKLTWFREWGDISASKLAELKQANVFIKLYILGRAVFKRIPPERLVYCLRREGANLYVAFITRDPQESLGLPEIEVPREDLSSLHREISLLNADLEGIDKRISELCVYRNYLAKYRKQLLKGLEFYNVRFGMAEQEGICCLRGFLPTESVSRVSEAAVQTGWATVIEEPDDPDQVPTLIRNPKWVEMIRPIFQFMGTLPGYKEYDISFCFLLFFSVFFAMLIGDAGYGLLFLALTILLRRRFKGQFRQLLFLLYVLSSGTIIWGAASGTWFGFEKIAQLPLLNLLVIGRIDSFVSTNQLFMIYLCFLIGAIHLSIAHAIVSFRFINSWRALAEIGWIGIIWTAFFLAGVLVLNRPIPDFALIPGIAGAGLVILFSHPQKNILKGVLISLANLPLKAISSFSDVISYLRLFAVGYATVSVAGAFNNMAFAGGINNIFAGFIAALILFLGHALNILLGLMAVIVHGIRLNMLEFSGHLNMQWSGKEYAPFKE
ncbi:MAG: hypothetical protein V1674_03815 [Candidatus Omnitrophota bacterium]